MTSDEDRLLLGITNPVLESCVLMSFCSNDAPLEWLSRMSVEGIWPEESFLSSCFSSSADDAERLIERIDSSRVVQFICICD